MDLYVIWGILKMLKILVRTLYLMFSPLMLVKILLMMKVINLLQKDGKIQIKIHPLQCMLILHNINSKR